MGGMGMSNIREIKPTDRIESVKRTLSDFSSRADELNGVIIIGLRRDGTQELMRSSMSGIETAF
jgi:hypothetical protein